MRSPDPESTRALASAELAHHAIRCAVASIEAARGRLLYDVRLLALDSPLATLIGAIEQRCMRGGALADLLSEPETVALADPADSLDAGS